ncbi:hypothetical protein BC628DRAFT_1340290 [Trametes gibbosa]|nr:hypothetical protein BC628DRAFT_1340290 [Trametes gibbosa]
MYLLPSTKEQLKRLNDSILYKLPYCEGTRVLSEDDFTLYYGRGTNVRRIDLANASSGELQRLAEACDPATFGRGQQDVHDETYRKAGKLDVSEFMLRFSPDSLGLLDTIRTELLLESRRDAKRLIRAQLYKLNVYGPQSFFKSHVDTPRRELLLGTLVIVFPTPHEGGALVLRERKGEDVQEWTFDPAALLAQAARPSIAYVAFYSDIEHEVMPVQSGYRVTLTYKLYYLKKNVAAATPVPAVFPLLTNEDSFRETLRALLEDPTFLPDGDSLMFALRHQYPLSPGRVGSPWARKALREVKSRLKGMDALVLNILREHSLEASIMVIYEERDGSWEKAHHLDHSLNWWLQQNARGKPVDAHWVASVPWSDNVTEMSYVAYGRRSNLEHGYCEWKLGLLVEVGAFGERHQPVPRESDY